MRYINGRWWKWEVTLTYNDTVEFPKTPGDIAIKVLLADDFAKDMEVAAAQSRDDVNIEVIEFI